MIHEDSEHAYSIIEAILDMNSNASDYVRQIEILDPTQLSQVYYAATLTDEFRLGIWGDEGFIRIGNQEQYSKLLELRVFDKHAELKVWRSDIGSQFQIRIIDDQNASEGLSDTDDSGYRMSDFFEEVQLLDIDRQKSKSANDVKATGGGAYSLPDHIFAMKNPGLIVRHYFDKYEQSGNAYITDWRCVGFMNVSE